MTQQIQQTQQSDQPDRRRSKLVTIGIWGMVVVLIPASLAWVLGRWVYWFDLVGSQQMLISFVVLIGLMLALLGRRWRAGMVCLVLAGVSFYPVLVDRVWVLSGVDLQSKPDGVIRVVSSNIYPRNEHWRVDLDELMATGADVIVLLEVPPELSRAIRKHGYLDSSAYPHWAHRAWVDQETSPCFILSRWSIDRLDLPDDPIYAQEHLFTHIATPKGELVFGLVHPLSPRTIQRWRRGNGVIRSQARAVEEIESKLGLAMLIGADLNAGPAQQRARALRSSGLLMSKPVTRFGGSFPAGSSVPRAVQIELDDVWSLGPIKPVAWDMIELSGSDHRAVVVDFILDKD